MIAIKHHATVAQPMPTPRGCSETYLNTCTNAQT